MIRILVWVKLVSDWLLGNHVLWQAALDTPKLKPVKCFLVLLSKVFKRLGSSYYNASIILLIDELFIQLTDG
jgi:hypothetical protein